MSQRYSKLGLPRRYTIKFLPERRITHIIRRVETDDCGNQEVTLLNTGYRSYKQARAAATRMTRAAHCRQGEAVIVRYYPACCDYPIGRRL